MDKNIKTLIILAFVVIAIGAVFSFLLYRPPALLPAIDPIKNPEFVPGRLNTPLPSEFALAFSLVHKGNEDIYTIDDKGELSRLTYSRWREYLPSWSPSRNWIAYVSDEINEGGDIWIMKADGTSKIRLTNHSINTLPTWSKDGRTILFLSNRNNTRNMNKSIYWSQLRLYHFSLINATPVYRPPVYFKGMREQLDILDNVPFQTLRDGKVVFSYRQANPNSFIQQSAVLLPNNNYTSEDIFSPGYFPIYNPGRYSYVYSLGNSKDAELYLSIPEVDSKIQITNNTIEDRDPEWSPDGNYIAYFSEFQDGSQSIMIKSVIKGDAGFTIKLINGEFPRGHFLAWSR